jgi:hypothetical protein
MRITALLGFVLLLFLLLLRLSGKPSSAATPDDADASAEPRVAAPQERHPLDELAKVWVPPAPDATAAHLFPPVVAGFTRIEMKDDERLRTFLGRLDVRGRYAVYAHDSTKVYICVTQADEKERAKLMDQVSAREVSGRYSGRLCKCGVCAEMGLFEEQHHIWWAKGWLVVVYAECTGDQEDFLLEYLKALDAMRPRV